MQQAINIKVLKHQIAFIKSEARHTGLVAGFGSGKSIAGTLKTIEKKKQYPAVNVAYYLPTYPLIKDIAFPNFEHWLNVMEIPYDLNKSDKEFITPLGKIILRSMDNPNLIVGYETGYSLIDESDILSKDKMKDVLVKIVARNRKQLPNNEYNQLDFVSTPEGFKFMYEFFVKDKTDDRVLIKAKTKDNPYLPDGYIETLTDIYSNEQLQAYLNGEFVNLTSGSVYRNFDRKLNHSNREVKKDDILHIGMDFNITNMNAVVHVIDGDTPIAVSEITGVYDTPEIIKLIQDKYKNKVVVYPDATSQKRNTSGSSDFALLKQAGFTLRHGKTNPHVKDRVTSMNIAFLDKNGNRVYKVNTNNCPIYTEALEQQVYKNGEPDKTGGLDHVTEAGGYFIHYNKSIPKISFSSGGMYGR